MRSRRESSYSSQYSKDNLRTTQRDMSRALTPYHRMERTVAPRMTSMHMAMAYVREVCALSEAIDMDGVNKGAETANTTLGMT